MLYDKRWDETKADPFSLESLISWLEMQPQNGGYVWEDCEGGCLMGIYGRAMGLGEDWHDLHYNFFKRGLLEIAGDSPHTFGAALKRARRALALS